jgi:hypothetical protein
MQWNNLLHATAPYKDGFLLKIHEFLQLTWMCIFGINWACLILAEPKLQHEFPYKVTDFSQGNNVLGAAASTKMVFF